jgi:hypothetical protein
MAYMLATVNETEQSDDKIDPEAIRKGLVRWERGKACRREAANDDSALSRARRRAHFAMTEEEIALTAGRFRKCQAEAIQSGRGAALW